MRRRGNKSSKVPNVKLRPADPTTSTNPSQSTWWAQDTQDPGPDATSSCLDLCPRPFKGIVVCATGVVDKPTLFKQAIELGATSMSAFTDRVTHLIAVDHGGAKYTCALERKIPILQPSWITESYQIWLKGDDVDLAQSIQQHRLPVFSNVILSLSGINDITRRTQIHKLVTQQQGVYVKNLERPVKVTHLLCSGDEETDKMRYAEKFNKRGEANIHVVWEEWFWDSLEFGGRFAEEKYQVVHPRPERKSTTDTPSSPPPPPASSALPSETSSPSAAPKPKSQPNPSDDAEDETELASIKNRVPAMTLHLWGSLLKPRGFEVTGGKLVRSPSKKPHPSQDAGPSRGPSPPREVRGSIISSFRRANSFVEPVQKEGTTMTNMARRPIRRIPTAANLPLPLAAGDGGRASSSSCMPPPISSDVGAGESPASGALFSGLRFRALGEAKSANVRTAVDGCGGRVVSDGEGEEVDYIIVRLVSGSKFYRDEPDETQRTKYRTECWLERCIFEERICPPHDHVSFTPLKILTPVPGADHINLSFSGLDQSEACWIRRLVRALGIDLAPNFSRRSTHLLCPSGTGAKFDKAREWGVPVVGMGWLAEMAGAGFVPPVAGNLVLWADGAAAAGVGAGGEPGGLEVVVERVEEEPPREDVQMGCVDKGKGKEKDDGIRVAHGMSPEKASPQRAARPLQAVKSLQLKPTPSPRGEQPAHGSFGRPAGALAQLQHMGSHASPPPPSRQRSPSLEYVTDPGGSLPRSPPCASASASVSAGPSASASGPSRRPTLGDIKRDIQVTRIPSSKSPSPMKLPQPGGSSGGSSTNGNGGRAAPPSPVKVPNEVTKALQDSITSLLGKRLPSDEDVGLRAGKRPRPKPRSRQESHEGASGSPRRTAPGPPPDPRSPSPFEPYDEMHGAPPVLDSMRVMYEDPGQRDEKRRLMSLFESQSEDALGSAKKARGLVRRSMRIAGF